VQLDETNWADVVDIEALRDGDRKRVNRAIRVQVDENQRPILPGSMEDDMRDAFLAEAVTDWSLPFPVPSRDAKSLDKLTIAQAAKLHEAVRPHMDLIKSEGDPTRRGTDPTAGSES